MGITFGDYLIDSGHYDPPDEETIPLDGYYGPLEEDTVAIPLEAMGGPNPEPTVVSDKGAISELVLRAMRSAWDAEVYGKSRAEEANRGIAAMTADAILTALSRS